MSIALRGEPFDCRGLIAVAPSVKDTTALTSHLDGAGERAVRGVTLVGADDRYSAACKKWHEEMAAAGVASDLTVIPGLGHDYPSDFATRLPSALDFLLDGAAPDAARPAEISGEAPLDRLPRRFPVTGEMTASEAIEDDQAER